MLIGYARISTHEQNLALQEDALKRTGCEKIFQDKVSGVAAERPGINQAISYLRPGDTLVVWRLDRLGRSLKHLITLIGELDKKDIGFRSLQEAIDTTTSGGKLIFHIFGALAEFERNLIQERTRAGLAAARARGKKGGRPKALNSKKREMLKKLYDERNLSIQEICDLMKISKTTLYSYLREQDASIPDK
jgi:DNA invertase Pin-like site-specific DNA recombinase